MKCIRLEYDQKLYKEKLEEHLEIKKKITKFHTIYSAFGILAAAITPLLVVFVHTIISGVKSFDETWFLIGIWFTIPLSFLMLIIYDFYILPAQEKPIEEDDFVFNIQSFAEIKDNAKFAVTESGEWLIWTKLDGEIQGWICLKELLDDFNVKNNIPEKWDTMTIQINADAKAIAIFS